MDKELLEAIGQLLDEKLSSVQADIAQLKEGQTKLEAGQAQLRADVTGLKSDVNELKADVTGLKSDVNELKADVAGLKSDMTAVKLTLEVDIPKQFGALTDGHKGLVEKFSRIDQMSDNLDEMKGSMVALETYILQNRSSIIELQKARS